MASPAQREMRKPDFPAVVHTYTDVLRLLREQPHGDAAHLAGLTGRVASNVRRDMHKLIDAGVIEHDGACWLLTDKGRQWVAGQDVAEGLASTDGSAAAVMRWPVDKIRPNPANRPVDRETIPDLALSIIGAGDILQPLILTPPDANGVRMILAGERRWRAVRHIMDQDAEAHNENVLEGEPVFFNDSLPVDLEAGVPFVEREATEAEALQITIIENSQRQDLSPWEDAQLLLQLQTATGWNASELARNIGRAAEGERSGLRDVQTKLKVAREASPAAIAVYLENRSWDQLRNSVSQPKPQTMSDQVAEYGAALIKPGEPTPLEEAIEAAPPPSAWLAEQKERLWPSLDALRPKQLLVLVEVGDLIARTNVKTTRYEAPCAESFPDPTKCAQFLIENAGLGFTHLRDEHTVRLADATWDWLIRQGLIRELTGAVPHRLGLLRQEALGIGAEAALRQSGRYWTEWLNLDAASNKTSAAKPAPSGPHVVNGIDYGNATRAQEARYAAGILQRPTANYGSSSRSETPAPSAEPSAETSLPATTIEMRPATAREELAEQRLERLGAALQVLTERLEPLLAALGGDRTEDGLITLETDDADYYEREISEACQWAEDALAETSTVFDGWGEETTRTGLSDPAVPIRKSITPDFIVCLEDGRKFKSLKRHLRTRYNLSPEAYRQRWGLPADYPMVAPNYAKAREDLARQMGLSRAGAR
jgi:predicted transcriptional regulator/ParB-like chromosome segregation protein Spo0J